jgi:hypothetical protein
MKQANTCHKVYKVFLFPNMTTTVFREYSLNYLRGKFTAEKGLDQQDLDPANAYHTQLLDDLWNPIQLRECTTAIPDKPTNLC